MKTISLFLLVLFFFTIQIGEAISASTEEENLPSFISDHIKIIKEIPSTAALSDRRLDTSVRPIRVKVTTTTCDITPGGFGGRKLSMYKKGSIDVLDGQKVKMDVNLTEWKLLEGDLHRREEVTRPVEDAVVTNLKAVRVAHFSRTRSGFGGRFHYNVKAFSVNFRVHSDSTAIGRELSGCIPRDTHTVEFYTHCYEVTSVERPPVRPAPIEDY